MERLSRKRTRGFCSLFEKNRAVSRGDDDDDDDDDDARPFNYRLQSRQTNVFAVCSKMRSICPFHFSSAISSPSSIIFCTRSAHERA